MNRRLLRRSIATAAAAAVMGSLLLFLLAPLIVVIGASFSPGATPYVRFPPQGFSLAWYMAVPSRYVAALLLSLTLALATAGGATLLAVPAALALVRGRFAGRVAAAALLRAPLQIPFIVIGIAFLQLYYAISGAVGLQLRGSFVGLLLGHVFLATPYAIGTVGAVLQRFNTRLEEAGRSLGATPWRVFRRVTLPILMPGVYAGALYAFIISFGETPVALFLGGPGMTTFPVEMLGAMQFDFDPSLLAISTLILLISAVVIALFQRIVGLDALHRTGIGRS